MTSFIRSLKKALADLFSNGFINLGTIFIIGLSIFMVATLVLFFENTARLMGAWAGDNRAMVYMQPEITKENLPHIKEQMLEIQGVKKIRCIPKDQALAQLADQFTDQEKIFSSLRENPLPHAMEIRIVLEKDAASSEKIADIIEKIRCLDAVESVVYAQGFLERFAPVFLLVNRTGWVLCLLFSLICVFITANTVRLALHSRELEVQIMRLIGATEHFIKMPFYLSGALQGFLGGLFGISLLMGLYYGLYLEFVSSLDTPMVLPIGFLPLHHVGMLICGSTFLGWFGCYLSLRRMV